MLSRRVEFQKKKLLLVLIAVISCASPDIPADCSLSELEVHVINVKYADCGIDNGELTVEAINGISPYTFQLDDLPSVSSSKFSDVSPGNHKIRVMDLNGCMASTETYIGSKEPFLVNSLTTPSGCGGSSGSITIQPLGGLPPYKYQLGENNDNYQQSNVWSGLTSGQYSIWVEDANTCFFGIYVFVPSGISYSQTIKPIIETNCTKSSCHDGTQSPDLRTYNSIKANSTKINDQITTGKMPPTSPLTPNEITYITCWINDKSPNN